MKASAILAILKAYQNQLERMDILVPLEISVLKLSLSAAAAQGA